MKDKQLRKQIIKKNRVAFVGVTIYISRIKFVNAFKEELVLDFEPITEASVVALNQSKRKKNVKTLVVKEFKKLTGKHTVFDIAQNNRIKLATTLKDAIENYKDFLVKNRPAIKEKDFEKINRYLSFEEEKLKKNGTF